METTMVNNLIKTLDSMKGKPVNLWHYSTVTLPPTVFHNFDWNFEETDNLDELLVFYNEQGFRTEVIVDEIFEVKIDDFLNEVVIYMSDSSWLQIWTEIE